MNRNVLYHGDCLEIMKSFPDNSIDMIITDPPYSKNYNWVWEFLSIEGYRVLKDNAHLISLLGHNQLPIAIEFLSKTLRYWWICGLENNRSNKLFGKNVIIKFKPAIWFIKGKRLRENDGYFPFDFIKVEKDEFKESKKKHRWGQPVTFFENFIKHCTTSESLILDMFAGSGTTGVACRNFNRDFILIEKEEKYCQIISDRLGIEING